jgi:hypothetical protein
MLKVQGIRSLFRAKRGIFTFAAAKARQLTCVHVRLIPFASHLAGAGCPGQGRGFFCEAAQKRTF